MRIISIVKLILCYIKLGGALKGTEGGGSRKIKEVTGKTHLKQFDSTQKSTPGKVFDRKVSTCIIDNLN